MNTSHSTAVRPIDRFYRTIQALETINVLVNNTLETGEDCSNIATGIYQLMEQQCCALHELYAHYEPTVRGDYAPASSAPTFESKPAAPQDSAPLYGADYYRETQKTIARLRAEGRTPDEIAVLTGLARDRVRIFLEAMPDEVKDAASRETGPRALRNSLIAESLKDGYEVSEIAQALNLKKQTVERVIAQLIGKNEEAATDTQEAVNA